MFEHWDSFYLLTGGAAGALIGLLFIVATLTKGALDPDSALRGSSIYMTPIVFHLAVVLAISGLATAPGVGSPVAAGALGLAAALGLFAGLWVIYHLGRGRTLRPAHWTDLWCYGAMPLAAHVALGASAAAVWLGHRRAADGVAVSVLALLLIAIRNAWDLVTWISAKGGSASPAGPEPKP